MTPIQTLPVAAAALMMLGACVAVVPAEEPPQPSACRAEDAAKLVGQVNPSEAVIKAVTGAEIVRVAGPNQPLTMDYRFERATIIKDPVSGRVLQATCG